MGDNILMVLGLRGVRWSEDDAFVGVGLARNGVGGRKMLMSVLAW